MDWLMNNPIANMYGPYFLVLYAFVIAATLAICRWKSRDSDPTASSSPPPIPPDPDPHEVAYLRSGENEVLKLVILDLVQHGYLQLVEKKILEGQVAQAPNHPDPRHLSVVERNVFDYFSIPRPPDDNLESPILASKINQLCAPYAARHESERLLTSSEAQDASRQVMKLGAFVIAGLGLYKLFAALTSGHTNVWFLILLGIGGLFLLVKVCRLPRLSVRGRAYLERYQQALEPLKASMPVLGRRQVDSTALLLVGAFGIGALSGTPYDAYQQIFRKQKSKGDWFGDGGGWFGDGGSWFGDGGGCGGCGGGCGGCGG